MKNIKRIIDKIKKDCDISEHTHLCVRKIPKTDDELISQLRGAQANIIKMIDKQIKELAIEWIKKDIENSIGFQPETLSYWHRKLPNGKVCDCEPEGKCDYHTKGKRLMEFLNITKDDLK